MNEITSHGMTLDNECTQVLVGPSALLALAAAREEPLGPRESFLVAHERLRTLAEIAPPRALAVVAVDGRAHVVDALFIPDRSPLIVGRHTRCRLRLRGAPVSLRHVAILARSEAGRPRFHVWDLNTGHPFLTEDGTSNLAVIAEGPTYLSIGPYALWIVPVEAARSWPPGAKEAWAALPPRAFVDRRSPETRRPPSVHLPAPRPPTEEISHVTMICSPLLLGADEGPEVGWGSLRIAFGNRKQRRPITAEYLERGVLIGRYDRCGFTIDSLSELSRVHLLLVRIGGEVWAIDTASTHGVRRGDQMVEAAVLGDRETLWLAGVIEIDWAKEHHAEA